MLGKGLKFVSINIRSLYPSIDELKCKLRQFDVIGVCETWLNSTYDDNLINFENFTLYRLDREAGNIINRSLNVKRGGGLVLYVGSKFLNHSSQINSCSTITKNLEQLWILLDKPNVRKIVVCILYRPPSGDVDTAIKELSNSIEYVQSLCDAELVVMGDMNVNYRDRHSKSFDKIKEFERVFNLTQLISEPTRVTLKSTSTIDLIWTNTLYVAEHGVLDTILSDHMPVFMIRKKVRELKEFKYIMGRSYKNYDIESFQKDIQCHPDWKTFWEMDSNPENLWKQMENIILECADYHCPIVRMRLRENSPSWLSHEIVGELYLKDDLYNKARTTGEERDWELFRIQNKRVKKLILESKEEYIKDLLDQNQGNPRKFWRCINEISGLGKNKKKKGLEKLLMKWDTCYKI